MARSFNGTSDRIEMAAGALAAVALDEFTLAAIVRANSAAATQYVTTFYGTGLAAIRLSSSGTVTLALNGNREGSPTVPYATSDGWMFLAVTKPAGNVPARLHKYVYATGTWTRSDTAATAGLTTATTSIVLGSGSPSGTFNFNGDLGVSAGFTVALSDAQIDSLPFSLAAWLAYSPAALFVLDQQTIGQAVPDWTGQGANQSSITGTSIAASSIPTLGYGHRVLTATRQAPPTAAPLSTLADDFDDNTVDTTKWPGSYGTVTETGGRARLTCDTSYNAYVSASVYSFDSFSVRAYPPAANGGTSNVYLVGYLRSAGQPAGTIVGFSIDAAAGTLSLIAWVGFSDAGVVVLTYDSTAHASIRVAISAGSLLWQTSPDGTTWTTRRSTSTPAWLATATDVSILFESHRDNGTTNYAEIDNFNVAAAPPAGAFPSGVAAATAVGSPAVALGAGVAPSGIPVTVGAGSPAVAMSLTAAPAGLAAPAAAGTPASAYALNVVPVGVPVAAAAGAPATAVPAAGPAGLAVPVAVGAPIGPGATTTPSGLAIPTAIGTPAVLLTLSAAPAGVAAVPAVGSPAVALPGSAPAGVAVAAVAGGPVVASVLAAAPAGCFVAVGVGAPSPLLPPETTSPNRPLRTATTPRTITTVTRDRYLTSD